VAVTTAHCPLSPAAGPPPQPPTPLCVCYSGCVAGSSPRANSSRASPSSHQLHRCHPETDNVLMGSPDQAPGPGRQRGERNRQSNAKASVHRALTVRSTSFPNDTSVGVRTEPECDERRRNCNDVGIAWDGTLPRGKFHKPGKKPPIRSARFGFSASNHPTASATPPVPMAKNHGAGRERSFCCTPSESMGRNMGMLQVTSPSV